MATVAVNEFIFKQPVRVGDILSFFSSITRVGNTSVTVQVVGVFRTIYRPGPVCEGDRARCDLRGH